MNISQRIGAILAFALGLMSVFAGGKVLLGIDSKDYTVLYWLVGYNVIFGAISLFVAYFIWVKKPLARTGVITVLLSHTVLLVYVKFISNTVASESVQAMTFRVSVWVLIAILTLVIPRFLSKKQTN